MRAKTVTNLRVIKVHHLRHTTASLLKKLHVPPRDAQVILGHAHISTTMQIYTHVDEKPVTTLSPGSISCSAVAKETVVSRRFHDLREGVLPGGAKGT
jgi:site-specific recombinase XerD